MAGYAHSGRPLNRIEIIKNGEIVRRIEAGNQSVSNNAWRSEFDERVAIDGTSWLAVRCFEARPSSDRFRFAHTAPVHVRVPKRPLKPRQFETEFLVKSVQTEIERNRDEYERALEIYQELHQGAESVD